ncbi:unnamed protein product [Ixodes hexagonus]
MWALQHHLLKKSMDLDDDSLPLNNCPDMVAIHTPKKLSPHSVQRMPHQRCKCCWHQKEHVEMIIHRLQGVRYLHPKIVNKTQTPDNHRPSLRFCLFH